MRRSSLRIPIAILLAILLGVALGSCTAVQRIRQHPWDFGVGTPPSPSGGLVSVDQEEFDFGQMDYREKGSHEFVFTNRGDETLTLNPGTPTCSCTVSEIKDNELAPGQSTKVLVSWHSKHLAGPFHHSVSIFTSDSLRPEVPLTIKGEYTQPV